MFTRRGRDHEEKTSGHDRAGVAAGRWFGGVHQPSSFQLRIRTVRDAVWMALTPCDRCLHQSIESCVQIMTADIFASSVFLDGLDVRANAGGGLRVEGGVSKMAKGEGAKALV